jgi:chromosome segregation ATPase
MNDLLKSKQEVDRMYKSSSQLCDKLSQQCEAYRECISSLEGKSTKLSAECENTSRKLEMSEKEVSLLSARLRDSDSSISWLQQMQQQQQQADTTLSTTLKASLEATQQELSECQKSMSALEGRYIASRDENVRLQRRLESLLQELQDERFSREESVAEARAQREDAAEYSRRCHELGVRHEDLRGAHEDLLVRYREVTTAAKEASESANTSEGNAKKLQVLRLRAI